MTDEDYQADVTPEWLEKAEQFSQLAVELEIMTEEEAVAAVEDARHREIDQLEQFAADLESELARG